MTSFDGETTSFSIDKMAICALQMEDDPEGVVHMSSGIQVGKL